MTARAILAVVRVMPGLKMMIHVINSAPIAEIVSIAVRTPVLPAVATGEDAEGAVYVNP